MSIIYPDTLLFDEHLPLERQSQEVQQAAAGIMRDKAPSKVEQDDCGGEHLRPVREIWALAIAELLRVYEYHHAPNHAACYALRGMTLILRPRLT